MAEPSEARFRSLALILLALAGPPLLLAVYFGLMFPGLTHPDALDFAQIGRNISSGRGFSTFILRPLALTSGHDPLHQPDVTHGPLYPFLLALAFGAVGARDGVVAAMSGLFYLLTIPVLYLLAHRMFGKLTANVVTLIFVFNALMLEYAISGLHITLFIFLATTLLLVIYDLSKVHAKDPEQGPDAAVVRFPRMKLMAAGGLASLLYLTEPMFFWVVPVVVGTAAWLGAPRRLRAALWCLLPFVILAGPWMVRNLMLTGNPIFGLRGAELWMHTKSAYPGYLAYRMSPDEVVPGIGLLKAVVQKLLFGVGQVIQAFPNVTASWVLAFLLPSLLFRFRDQAANTLRRFLMICFIAIFAGAITFGIQMQLFTALIPAMLIFAVAYMLYLLGEARLPRASSALATTLIVVVVAFPLLSDVMLENKQQALAEMTVAHELTEISRPNDVSLSDQPWIPAWYANRPSIWIPVSDDGVNKVREKFRTTRWLFLTDSVRTFSPEWRFIYDDFRNWNITWAIAKKTKQNEPKLLRISDERLKAPLFKSLTGFVSVPPLNVDRVIEPRGAMAVVALLPPTGNTNSGLARPNRVASTR